MAFATVDEDIIFPQYGKPCKDSVTTSEQVLCFQIPSWWWISQNRYVPAIFPNFMMYDDYLYIDICTFKNAPGKTNEYRNQVWDRVHLNNSFSTGTSPKELPSDTWFFVLWCMPIGIAVSGPSAYFSVYARLLWLLCLQSPRILFRSFGADHENIKQAVGLVLFSDCRFVTTSCCLEGYYTKKSFVGSRWIWLH